jgi:tRNA (guanine10-N2)-dimethyltransferase
VKLLLELSMECESLARSEAMCVAQAIGGHASVVSEEPGVLVMDTDADPALLSDRLALCHCISEHLFSGDPEGLVAMASGLDVQGPIRVHSTRIERSHPEVDLEGVNRSVGEVIGRRAGVDIHDPVSEVRVILSTGASVGRLLSRVDRSAYERRKVRYLPFNHPISIHPKFARALVNVTGVGGGGRLLDPFCGTGAIVMEAALCGCLSVGADISERMIEGARENLRTMNLQAELHRCDVGDIAQTIGQVDAIATDPPYGRSTSTGGESLRALLGRALSASAEVLDRGSRLAIVLHEPELVEPVEDFEIIESHSLWVHRSLTRNFCVLRRL